MSKTQPARGMRDFLPTDVRKRDHVIGVIKEVYESYGFEPLETPSVENLETLMGKYGEEGNQLIFKILKRGEKLDITKGETGLSDLALRYDLTVPLARVVANYRNELPKFFKRYQIQPVWRADRPARGRYREFYQCDVDAIGSSSMIVEAELISAICNVLTRLGFKKFSVLLNHRNVLFGLLEVANIPQELHTAALVALDKFDKIKAEGVVRELAQIEGISSDSVKFFESFLSMISESFHAIGEPFSGTGDSELDRIRGQHSLNEASVEVLRKLLADNERGLVGLNELETIVELTQTTTANGRLNVFPYLARGLSYYTGAIMEIGLDDGDFTLSLGGGGRYDGLIGMFGKEQIPACGFSLGLERILVVMEERGMFPESLNDSSADVMVTVWSDETAAESIKLAAEIRDAGLRALVYPEADKLRKQFKYAGQIGVKYVCVLGESEIAEGNVTIKNMETGEQETVGRNKLTSKLKNPSKW